MGGTTINFPLVRSLPPTTNNHPQGLHDFTETHAKARPKPISQATPMHTRSITKKLIGLGNGGYAFTSLSETGEGIHTHFEYTEWYGIDQSTKALLDAPTGGPASTSSLSSISSGSSSSDQSVFDGTLSSISPSNSSVLAPTTWDSYHNLPLFGPPTATASNNIPSSFRPLQRTSAQRWVRDPKSGELYVIFDGDSWPSVQTASSNGRSEQGNEDEIFEREYQAILKNRDCMDDLTRKSIEELDGDMTCDALQIFTNAQVPPAEEAPQVASGSTGKPLGPQGTELIDETFRPPPGELGVYPQQWVTHQSTLLRSQPTELNIL